MVFFAEPPSFLLFLQFLFLRVYRSFPSQSNKLVETGERGDRVKARREPGMSKMQQDPLRELTQQEEQVLQKLAKSTSERMDLIKRANALLAVKAGKSYSEAAT